MTIFESPRSITCYLEHSFCNGFGMRPETCLREGRPANFEAFVEWNHDSSKARAATLSKYWRRLNVLYMARMWEELSPGTYKDIRNVCSLSFLVDIKLIIPRSRVKSTVRRSCLGPLK